MVGADAETDTVGEPVFVAFGGISRDANTDGFGTEPVDTPTNATLCLTTSSGLAGVNCGEYLREGQSFGGTRLWIRGTAVEAAWFDDGADVPTTTTTLDVHSSCPDEYTTYGNSFGTSTFGDDDPLNDTRSQFLVADDVAPMAEHMAMRAVVAADESPLAPSLCTALTNIDLVRDHLETWNTEVAVEDDPFDRFEAPNERIVRASEQLSAMTGDWATADGAFDDTLMDPVTMFWLIALLEMPRVLTHVDPIEDATDEEASLMLLGLSGRHGLLTTETDHYPMRNDYLDMIDEAAARRCA